MKKISVLLVDDEEIVLAGWREELEQAGYTVWTALGGPRAIEMARDNKPDVVITDLVMPEVNGVEVCRQMKKLYPDIPVIYISGHPWEIEKHQLEFFQAGGRDELLRKPLLENELIEALEKVTMP